MEVWTSKAYQVHTQGVNKILHFFVRLKNTILDSGPASVHMYNGSIILDDRNFEINAVSRTTPESVAIGPN